MCCNVYEIHFNGLTSTEWIKQHRLDPLKPEKVSEGDVRYGRRIEQREAESEVRHIHVKGERKSANIFLSLPGFALLVLPIFVDKIQGESLN